MIKEDYVSFEIAKRLKEKGFDQFCNVWYSEVTPQFGGEKYTSIEFDSHNRFEENYRFICYAPTPQMAMKWLRETYDIHVVPLKDFFNGTYTGRIYDVKRENVLDKDDYIALVGYETYEQACEAGIKYCLVHLI